MNANLSVLHQRFSHCCKLFREPKTLPSFLQVSRRGAKAPRGLLGAKSRVFRVLGSCFALPSALTGSYISFKLRKRGKRDLYGLAGVASGRWSAPKETIMNLAKYTERARGFVQSAQS